MSPEWTVFWIFMCFAAFGFIIVYKVNKSEQK